jgi:riboflavin synthase
VFTGIVEEVGVVRAVEGGRLTFDAARVREGTALGDSIGVNGVCLTVVALDAHGFAVDAVPETLRRSNLGDLGPGDPVNLERALAAGQRMGGHFVQGHVEGTGRIESRRPDGEALLLHVALEPALLRFVVPKGFIAVDGASLTVIDVDGHGFSFTVIPFTQANTVLGRKAAGDRVNIETDILGRYIERLLATSGAPSAGGV